MREIKFRAWNKDRKEMLNVQKMSFKTGKILPYGWNIEHDGKSFELMQYTGLKDKNEKEIYEGDIYHMGDKNIRYVVVWNDTGLTGKQLGSSSYAGLSFWRDKIEVIGNIYENPKLLK